MIVFRAISARRGSVLRPAVPSLTTSAITALMGPARSPWFTDAASFAPGGSRSPCASGRQGADLVLGNPRGGPCGVRCVPWEVVAVSDGQGSGPASAVRTPVSQPVLSLALTSMMDAVGAHSGAVYLRAGDEPVLEMAVMAGLPRSFAAPWERVGLSAPIPVAEAVRERRLVWVGGEEDMARRYPRIAVVLPYPFALAAVPVASATRVYGAVFVTWPGSHPPELSEREREQLTSACERLAMRLERAEAQNLSLRAEADLLDAGPLGGVAETLGAGGG